MQLYVLYGGDIICTDASQLNDGKGAKDSVELANPVFLIQHPKGTLVWDSGLSDNLIQMKEGIDAWIFHLEMKQTLLSQMEVIGIPPKEIDYFAFSHTHNDHTGNAHYFKRATLIMQQEEYESAFNTEKKPFNYSDYQVLATSKNILLKGDYDLFGDGKVRFIATPGHTDGHQSLLLDLPETGKIIISGDIAYYEENYRNKGIPTFNANREASLKSIEKIERLTLEEDVQLWIQHDKDQFRKLKKSPEYYS